MLSSTVKWLDLVAIFALELCMLVALGFWGVRTGGGPLGRIALGVAAPLAMAIVWGMFAAPKAKVRLHPTARLALKVALFAVAALALAAAGQPVLGVALFLAFCVTQGLAVAMGV